jgi:hypothetical protein
VNSDYRTTRSFVLLHIETRPGNVTLSCKYYAGTASLGFPEPSLCVMKIKKLDEFLRPKHRGITYLKLRTPSQVLLQVRSPPVQSGIGRPDSYQVSKCITPDSVMITCTTCLFRPIHFHLTLSAGPFLPNFRGFFWSDDCIPFLLETCKVLLPADTPRSRLSARLWRQFSAGEFRHPTVTWRAYSTLTACRAPGISTSHSALTIVPRHVLEI